MFNGDAIMTQTDHRTGRLPASGGAAVPAPTALASRKSFDSRASATGGGSDNLLELIVYWRGPLVEIRTILERISDWGPFELTEAAPLGDERCGTMRVFCSFRYHGSRADCDHFEWNLKVLLKDYAVWEDAAPPEPAAQPRGHRR